MVNINDLHKRFLFMANDVQQGYISPERIDALAFYASMGLFKQRLGLPEQMEFQTAMPKIAYARTKKIHTDLEPFRKIKSASITNNQLLLTQIPDCAYILNVRYKTIVEERNIHLQRKLKNCGCKPDIAENQLPTYITYLGDVDLVEEDKWSNRVNSSIVKHAIYCTYSDRILFYFPLGNVSDIEVHYLSYPSKPLWNYALINDEPDYTPTGSIHLEWSELLTDELASRMLKEYSKYDSDQLGIQYAQQKITNGE